MFTGIVEERGRVVGSESRGGVLVLRIGARRALEGVSVGDSIAVAGVCLTVTTVDDASFEAEAVHETLARTHLGALQVGDEVNLERALPAGRPMGGHYVQGHVDGTATVVAVAADGGARNVTFRTTPALRRFVVEKGYVALDGVSLTVVKAEADTFSVTLVPHTQSVVTLGKAAVGATVNLEVDIMAKYVEQAMGPRLAELEREVAALRAALHGAAAPSSG